MSIASIDEANEALAASGNSKKSTWYMEPIENAAIMTIKSPDISTNVKIEFVQADSLMPYKLIIERMIINITAYAIE